MSIDKRISDMGKVMEHSNSLKASRFWALWLVLFIFVVGFAAPHVLEWFKAFGWVE